ncbi:MAG: biopolymer transporter ExbD [Pirellulales bacterium]
MKFKSPAQGAIKPELQMTSMIDIVFLLLIFFILTFKIAPQEGDFNIKMPSIGEGRVEESSQLPLKLRLVADKNGSIADIIINDGTSFGNDFSKLRNYVLQLVGGGIDPSSPDSPEIEIDLDYQLKYEHVIEAITAVTGYKKGGDIVRIVDKIKFAPPRKPAP